MPGIRVTATDLEHPADPETVEILDDYCLVTAGRCEVVHRQVFYRADGTQTHIIRIRGVRR